MAVGVNCLDWGFPIDGAPAMTAAALALPTPLPTSGLLAPAAPVAVAPVAGLALLATNCVEQTAELMRLACRRGQLEDASTAARIALPLAVRNSPHEAMLRALGETHALLMQAPEERQLYLVREADGRATGVIRLRDNGHIGLQAVVGAQRWALRNGNLELCGASGEAHPARTSRTPWLKARSSGPTRRGILSEDARKFHRDASIAMRKRLPPALRARQAIHTSLAFSRGLYRRR